MHTNLNSLNQVTSEKMFSPCYPFWIRTDIWFYAWNYVNKGQPIWILRWLQWWNMFALMIICLKQSHKHDYSSFYLFCVIYILSQWNMERWNMPVRCSYLEIDWVAMVIYIIITPWFHKTLLKGSYLGFECCHSDLQKLEAEMHSLTQIILE